MNPFLAAVREYYDVRDRLNAISLQQGPMPSGRDSTRDELRRRKKNLEATVLGHPMSFYHCRCWMIDVVGRSRFDAKDDEMFHRLLSGFMEGRHDTVDLAGKLARQVREFIEQGGIGNLTDSGMGADSWHLGTHCTEREAHDLCAALYRKYGELIERGVLKIERTAWSLRLKDESLLKREADGHA